MLSNTELNKIIKKHNQQNCIKNVSKLTINQKNKVVNQKAPKLYKQATKRNPPKTVEGEIVNLDLADDRVQQKKSKIKGATKSNPVDLTKKKKKKKKGI